MAAGTGSVNLLRRRAGWAGSIADNVAQARPARTTPSAAARRSRVAGSLIAKHWPPARRVRVGS